MPQLALLEAPDEPLPTPEEMDRMPELPEVETIRRGLQRELVGRRIVGVDWRDSKLRGGPSPRPLEELEGQRVLGLRRHGKFLLWDLSGGGVFLAHLGMTGKVLFSHAGEERRPHTHLTLYLDDERELRYSDPRRFGVLKLFPKGAGIPDLEHYGIDALDPAFTPQALGAMLPNSAAPLKAFLMDQTWIAGVGNIYACEALWRAKLSPRLKAKETPRAKVKALHKAILGVLHDSLAAGGTSFNDYVDAIGTEGSFMLEVAVFQRHGEPCPRCGTKIRRLTQANRSTFYCPVCQA